MTREELKQANARIVEKTQKYADLMAIPEFREWHKESVEAELSSLQDRIVGIDRGQPDWKEKACDMIAAYQETNRLLKVLFFKGASENAKARKALRELETSGD